MWGLWWTKWYWGRSSPVYNSTSDQLDKQAERRNLRPLGTTGQKISFLLPYFHAGNYCDCSNDSNYRTTAAITSRLTDYALSKLAHQQSSRPLAVARSTHQWLITKRLSSVHFPIERSKPQHETPAGVRSSRALNAELHIHAFYASVVWCKVLPGTHI